MGVWRGRWRGREVALAVTGDGARNARAGAAAALAPRARARRDRDRRLGRAQSPELATGDLLVAQPGDARARRRVAGAAAGGSPAAARLGGRAPGGADLGARGSPPRVADKRRLLALAAARGPGAGGGRSGVGGVRRRGGRRGACPG